MNTTSNILIICSWNHRDPLITRYVLPNIPLIQGAIEGPCLIHLMTAEPEWPIQDENFTSTLAQLGVTWFPTKYASLSARGWWLWAQNLMGVRRYCRQNQIATVHAFAPLAGALAWIATRWSKRRLIIDSWEPHADAMVETGVWKPKSLAFSILFALEKRQSRDADFLIAAQPSMVEYCKKRYGIEPKRVAYKPACIDFTIFDPNLHDKNSLRVAYKMPVDQRIGICVSQLGGMYYLKETLSLLHHSVSVFGPQSRFILLTSTSLSEINACAHQNHFDLHHVTVLRCAPQEVPRYLAMADYALNPQMAVPSKKYGTPVKNGEYWAMGLPILLMPDTSQDSDLVIEHGIGIVMQGVSHNHQINALESMSHLICAPEIAHQCRRIALKYRHPDIAKLAYEQVYGRNK